MIITIEVDGKQKKDFAIDDQRNLIVGADMIADLVLSRQDFPDIAAKEFLIARNERSIQLRVFSHVHRYELDGKGINHKENYALSSRHCLRINSHIISIIIS